MRDWNYPRALVERIDVLFGHREDGGDSLSAAREYIEDLSHRTLRLGELVVDVEEVSELEDETESLLAELGGAMASPGAGLDDFIELMDRLAVLVERWKNLALELPRATGQAALDELFVLGMHAAGGLSVEPEAILARVPAAREAVVNLERRAALFAQAFPQESEITEHLAEAVEQLQESLGAFFLFLTGDEPVDVLRPATQLLAQGGATAVACMSAARAVADEAREFSRDPALESLHEAVIKGARERIEVALVALEESHGKLRAEVQAMSRLFAPHSWKERHLPPLEESLDALEATRESLANRFLQGDLGENDLIMFRGFAERFEVLEERAMTSLPSIETLPESGRLKDLLALVGAVYEERAPLALLQRDFLSVRDDFEQYSLHLERLYASTSPSEAGEIDELLTALDELRESLELLEDGMEKRDVTRFPEVWDRMAPPLEVLARFQKPEAEPGGLGPEPLPPAFQELRSLFLDRLVGLVSEEEFDSVLARANSKLTALSRELRKLEPDRSVDNELLESLLSDARTLLRGVRQEVTQGDLAELEEIARMWANVV